MSGRNISTEEESAGVPEPSRRAFLKGSLTTVGAALLGGAAYLWHSRESTLYAGGIMGASSQVGHLLRDARLPKPDSEISAGTVIVGGGIAGLSAAWWLKKHHHDDFLLLELEPETGGNSRSGKNAVSAYPWGAHYVPLPGPDAHLVRMLFEELSVIRGYDEHGAPIYDELYLCADPHERLFYQGRWQEGLVPHLGVPQEEKRQYAEFFAAMERFKSLRGSDGKRAFSIPLDASSRDPALLALDRITMEEYMKREGWTSPSLHWYVRYCCRDDYGMGHEHVSAWAGIHYFAARDGVAANAEPQTVLTWPEGNGWLVERLRSGFAQRVRTNSLVYAVDETPRGVAVDYWDVTTKRATRVLCKQAIFAGPRFAAARVMRGLKERGAAPELSYAPWLVANVTLRSLPSGGKGAPLSWDNVSYYSQSLGYVVATHQKISLFPKETVLTYYRPLDDLDPKTARQNAIAKTHGDWSRIIADDLDGMHNGIKRKISNIDVCVWGHGMVSPHVGYLWGEERRRMLASFGAVHFAHSDMSGISTFEEAQYRGVEAANRVLEALSKKRSSVI